MDYLPVIRGLTVLAAIVVVGYVFAKTLQHTGSFSRAILAVSVTIDFVLFTMWVLGIDRPLWRVTFQRTGASITVTALTLFLPVKLLFTLYLFAKQRQLRELLG